MGPGPVNKSTHSESHINTRKGIHCIYTLKIIFLLFTKTNFKLEYQGVIIHHNNVQHHPLQKHMHTCIIHIHKYLHTYIHIYIYTCKQTRKNERKEGSKKERKKAYFSYGMNDDDDFRVHVNDTTRVVMICL